MGVCPFFIGRNFYRRKFVRPIEVPLKVPEEVPEEGPEEPEVGLAGPLSEEEWTPGEDRVEHADALGTIGYEIVCGVSGRIPRVPRRSIDHGSSSASSPPAS